ncbi:MAG TPA: maleylpyruvate isomerase family mycothiol-dependent enzyme [Streptosporangiaceae bacterium]
MAAADTWPQISAEREALAGDLAGLQDDRWSTGSLCPGWSVRDVLGHMTATAKMTPAGFFAALARAGFSFDKMTAQNISRETAGTPAEGLAEFRRIIPSTSHPPGPPATWLGEALVHGEDIRRPLGINRAYPTAALIRVANFYQGSNLLIGSKKRIAGLQLRATDAEWSTGSGPEVRGPMLSLVLAMTGRAAALDDLSGDGLAEFRSRFSPPG